MKRRKVTQQNGHKKDEQRSEEWMMDDAGMNEIREPGLDFPLFLSPIWMKETKDSEKKIVCPSTAFWFTQLLFWTQFWAKPGPALLQQGHLCRVYF